MNWRKFLTIAGREFRAITATKTFIIMTVIGPLLIFVIAVVPSLLSNSLDTVQEGSRIAVFGADPDMIEALQAAFADSGIRIEEGEEFAETKLRLADDGKLQGILEIPAAVIAGSSSGMGESAETLYYYSRTGTDIVVYEMLRNVVGGILVARRMAEAGFSLEEVQRLSNMPALEVRKVGRSGETEEGQDLFSIIMLSVSFILLLYMSILLYGQMAGRAVVVEKTSKTVELLLSSARPQEILLGKVFGIGSAGLLQYAVWVGAGLLILTVFGPLFNFTAPAGLTPRTLFFLVIFFLAAFILYATIYAALGAAAEDEQNLGQLAWPLIMFLIIPMVMVSPLVMNPNAPLAVFFSFFPFTSPIVMFIRVMVSMPPIWELLLSLAIMGLSTAAAAAAAARIFRAGILMTGKRATFKELMVWLRYPQG
jgi:ABC-2 type transport system permease protein